jgi:hypothetical protein
METTNKEAAGVEELKKLKSEIKKILYPDVDDITHTHKYFSYKRQSWGSFFILALPSFFIYWWNPCITYATTAMWAVGGLYIFFIVYIIMLLFIYDIPVLLCNDTANRNHLIYEVLMFSSYGASIAFYQMYAYFSGIGSVFSLFGCLLNLFILFVSQIQSFLSRHFKNCPQRSQEHEEVTQGNLKFYKKNFLCCCDLLFWAAIAVLGAMMYYYKSDYYTLRPPYYICQAPLYPTTYNTHAPTTPAPT